MCSLIEYNSFTNRLSYIQNYNKTVVVPLFHLNAVNFIGMGNKHEYLIWREKNGFFTALNRTGNLSTWSNLSGKLLYKIKQSGDASKEQCENYEVYRADA